MDSQKPSKSISTSTPSFSIRYNAEDEEVEQLYDLPKFSEAHSDNSSPQSTPVAEKKPKEKSARRSGSFEDGTNDKEPWRLFTEIRGRITKRVEEKLEEIKTERLIKDKMKKEKRDKQLKSTNSLSDSEDRSEDTSTAAQGSGLSSVSNASSSPEKTKSVPNNLEESDLGDISGSEEGSSPERPSTPTFTDDLVPQRPRPSSSTSSVPSAVDVDKKDRSKIKGIKFKFIKKKGPASTSTVEVGVDALEQVISKERPQKMAPVLPPLILPKRNYAAVRHKYTWTVGAAVAFALLSYLVQKPSFMLGFSLGVIVAFIAVLWSSTLYKWVCVVDPEVNFLRGDYTFQNVPFLSDNVLKDESIAPEEQYHKGWMNEYSGEYDPQTYRISQTEPIFVKLVGSILQLYTPPHKIPKRAFWTEGKHKLLFTQGRCYDLFGCQVKLLPEELIHKRKWSRKYPIVIYLLPNSHLGTTTPDSKHVLSDTDYSYYQKKLFKETADMSKKSSRSSPQPLSEDTSPVSDETTPNVEKTKRNNACKEAVSENGASLANVDSEADDAPPFIVSEIPEDEVDDDDMKDFVNVSPIPERSIIILFARTAREKDLWFRRLIAATTYKSVMDGGDQFNFEEITKLREKRVEENKAYLNFIKSLGQLRCLYEGEYGVVSFDNTNKDKDNYLWLNIFLSRILYDTIKEEIWIEAIKNKIQKKLSVIRVPTFIEPIRLSKIEFSNSVPVIEWTHNVNLNNDGIWTEVEISYKGTTTMTVDTKVNVQSLIKTSATKNQIPADKPPERETSRTAYKDSSQEDSGETSSDESMESAISANKAKLMFDKIAASNFFQHITDSKLIRKGLEKMSNTTVSLNVQVKSLVGTLVLNIPPPPTDRLWFGFKPNVQIHMKAKPIFGETNINMHYITSMIEKTLRSEFQKVLVMPNMDDLVIPIMTKQMPY